MSKTSIFRLQIGIILLFLLAKSTNLYSGEEQTYHFRHTRWGMSQEEVTKTENGKPEPDFSKQNSLTWKAEVMGEQVLVVYTFAFNKLVRTKYMLLKSFPYLQKSLFPLVPERKPVAGEYVLDFMKFRKTLIEKYGTPDENNLRAPKEVNENKDSDPEAMNKKIAIIEEAIRDNKIAWYCKWKTKDTSVVLMLRGERGINLEIGYSSVALSQLESESPL